jgi:hypothetical protein
MTLFERVLINSLGNKRYTGSYKKKDVVSWAKENGCLFINEDAYGLDDFNKGSEFKFVLTPDGEPKYTGVCIEEAQGEALAMTDREKQYVYKIYREWDNVSHKCELVKKVFPEAASSLVGVVKFLNSGEILPVLRTRYIPGKVCYDDKKISKHMQSKGFHLIEEYNAWTNDRETLFVGDLNHNCKTFQGDLLVFDADVFPDLHEFLEFRGEFD